MILDLAEELLDAVAGGKGAGLDPNGGDTADHGSHIDPNG